MSTTIRPAVSGAVLTLLLGFGVMTVLWTLLPQDADLPGHWDYLSGTVGDAVLLPVLVGSLVHLAATVSPRLRWRTATTVGASLGAMGGLAVQASWLLDPLPRRNWVLPEPGTFTLPGWYHAVFLVLAAGTIGGLLLTVLVEIHGLDRPVNGRDELLAVALVNASTTTFVGLVLLDSAVSLSTSSSTTTVALSGLGLLGTVVGMSCANRVRSAHLPLVGVGGILVGTTTVGVVLFLT